MLHTAGVADTLLAFASSLEVREPPSTAKPGTCSCHTPSSFAFFLAGVFRLFLVMLCAASCGGVLCTLFCLAWAAFLTYAILDPFFRHHEGLFLASRAACHGAKRPLLDTISYFSNWAFWFSELWGQGIIALSALLILLGTWLLPATFVLEEV